MLNQRLTSEELATYARLRGAWVSEAMSRGSRNASLLACPPGSDIVMPDCDIDGPQVERLGSFWRWASSELGIIRPVV